MPSSHASANAKRIVDVVLALVLGVLLLPVFVVIPFLIYLDSPGPVIFRQRRMGHKGKEFEILKFRKFPSNWGTKGPMVTVANDLRMTRIGRILERTKLDELPQLWNILKGEMSFVGPRPESLRYSDMFEGRYKDVLEYVPGIFGPNQVEYRNESQMYPAEKDPEEFYRETLFPAKAENDLAYFSNATLVGDFAWIAKGTGVSIFNSIVWSRRTTATLILILIDIAATMAGWALAHWFRFSILYFWPQAASDSLKAGLWVLPLALLLSLVFVGVYRYPGRYFSERDVYRLSLGVTLGWTIGFFIVLAFFARTTSISLGPLGLVIAFVLMLIPRLTYRLYRQRDLGKPSSNDEHGRRIAIYGAGRRGVALARLITEGYSNTNVCGFFDDTDNLNGQVIHGIRVLGSERDLNTAHQKHELTDIWLSYKPHPTKFARLNEWSRENNVSLEVIPLKEPFASLH